MEERVRICDGCSAVVGWFARFCEECGAPQQPKAPPVDLGGGFLSPDGGGIRAAELLRAGTPSGSTSVESAGAAVLTAAEEGPVAEARTAARELFRSQLRLMHRTSEKAEVLAAEIRTVRADTASALRGTGGAARRERLTVLSERLMAAEAAWDEIQRVYNRESEASEEEWQAVAEGAQVDAYLTPAEEDAIGLEFSALHRRFETAEGELRQAGREVARARKEAHSTIFGIEVSSRPAFLATLVSAVGLFAVSVFTLADRLGLEVALTALSPAAVGLLAMTVLAAKRG